MAYICCRATRPGANGSQAAGHDISTLAEDDDGCLLVGTAAGSLFRGERAGASWSQVGAAGGTRGRGAEPDQLGGIGRVLG